MAKDGDELFTAVGRFRELAKQKRSDNVWGVFVESDTKPLFLSFVEQPGVPRFRMAIRKLRCGDLVEVEFVQRPWSKELYHELLWIKRLQRDDQGRQAAGIVKVGKWTIGGPRQNANAKRGKPCRIGVRPVWLAGRVAPRKDENPLTRPDQRPPLAC